MWSSTPTNDNSFVGADDCIRPFHYGLTNRRLNMEYHRKSPRLAGFDYRTQGAYFITICIKERHEILGTIQQTENEIYNHLSEYGLVVEKYLAQIRGIDCYVVMPNHIHMIIMILEENESTIQQRIATFKTLVTKELGFTIFQRSFHDHIIRNEQEYLHIQNYIMNNPQNWANDCFHNSENDKRIDMQ